MALFIILLSFLFFSLPPRKNRKRQLWIKRKSVQLLFFCSKPIHFLIWMGQKSIGSRNVRLLVISFPFSLPSLKKRRKEKENLNWIAKEKVNSQEQIAQEFLTNRFNFSIDFSLYSPLSSAGKKWVSTWTMEGGAK